MLKKLKDNYLIEVLYSSAGLLQVRALVSFQCTYTHTMESSPMLVNHPRVAANAVLSPPEEADSPAAHPRPRQGPANKQLDFDLSDDELNVSSSDTKVSLFFIFS